MDYKSLNDYELVSLAQENNEDAINILHKKYYPLILKKGKKVYPYLLNKGIELSDLIQECMIGFEESIKDFNEKDNVTFYTFTNICMDRQLKTEIKKLDRNKNKLLNEAIPLEKFNENNEKINLIDFIKDEHANPELDLLKTENYNNLWSKLEVFLTDFEKKVLLYRLEDYSYNEIAKLLNINKKSIDNAIQRIRNKVEKFIIV